MESHQPLMLSNSPVVAGLLKPNPDSVVRNFSDLSKTGQKNENLVGNKDGFVGVLEVFIHQARDIHNICIYQKQDVYAKLCLTSDPETKVSTQIINGGGRNPVFSENLQLSVRTLETSLRCEIWMLSRVRNYLEDQLLGFAVVPLSDVVVENGKLAQEFELSSSDLFHSPAGFVQLTLTYTGGSPDVLEIPTPRFSLAANGAGQDADLLDSVSCELDKIEFPDPNIVNQNETMVSEYFGIPCANLDSETTESFDTTENVNHASSEASVHVLENLTAVDHDEAVVSKVGNPPTSVLTNGSPSVSVTINSHSVCDTPRAASASSNQDVVSSEKEKIVVKDAESGSSAETSEKEKTFVKHAESGSAAVPVTAIGQPVISINVEPEQKLVQQEIVDMYNKSMQQFTEALEKMKLPLDIDNGSSNSGNLGPDEKVQASKDNGPSPRVFYGSRAFF